MASEQEIEAAAKAMFIRICTNADPEETWREILAMPQHGPIATFYREHARVALEAAAAVRWTRTAVPPAQGEIDAAAASIKEMIRGMDYHAAEVAGVALAAAERVREPVVFTTLDGSHRCEVNGPQHIVIQKMTRTHRARRVETRGPKELNRESNRKHAKET